MNKKTLIILFLITLLGAILRLWQLGAVPISPDWDEVALGYNAYSILHTGRDEYGKLLPVVLQSFDDYKPALYTYLIIPLIPLFDLTVFTVRLPSALFGIATIVAVFFLVRELFKKDSLALFASFLLAISPWHIQFSRVAFETNVGLALNVFTALAFIKGLRKPWILLVSVICADLSMYVYQSEKVFTPLLLLALVMIYHREVLQTPKKYLIAAAVIGIIAILPMIQFTLTNRQAFARAKGVSIFSQSSLDLERNSRNGLYDTQHHDYIGSVLSNRRIVYAKEIAANYLSHFSLNWLFITGDINRHHAPYMGLLYLWELPFILIGMYQLIFGKYDKKTKAIVFTWFLIAPIPAAVTTGVPHAVRTLNFLPTYQIFTAIGILWFMEKALSIKYLVFSIKMNYVILLFTSFIFIFNISYYLDQYFVQQNYFNAEDWQYGYAKVIPHVQNIAGKYKKVVVSNQAPMDQSYMFFLFYLKYPPKKYQHEDPLNTAGFKETHIFGNYEFRPIDWSKDKKSEGTLFIGRPQDFPNPIPTVETVSYPDGIKAMEVVENK